MIKKILGQIWNMFDPLPAMPMASFPEAAVTVATEPLKEKANYPMPVVAFVNVSTVMTDAEMTEIVAALQIQVSQDFAPVWKIDADLIIVPKNQTPPEDAWILYVMDHSDQDGALGYHDITPMGNPIGKVFAKDDMKYGLNVSVTMSHELLEMLVDPFAQNCAFIQESDTTGILFAYEVSDAVQADELGKEINGIVVSDFVYPSWFEAFRKPNSTKFDHHGVLTSPLELAPGGYIGLFAVGSSTTGGWTQKMAESTPSRRMLAKGPYSRFNRRAHKALNK